MYCVRKDIELVYGEQTIFDWADINGNCDPGPVLERINWAIARAATRINSRLRTRFTCVPFDPVPEEIKEIAADLAGYYLWHARMLDKTDKTKDNYSHMHDGAEGRINEIVSGVTALEVEVDCVNTNAPTVVESKSSSISGNTANCLPFSKNL